MISIGVTCFNAQDTIRRAVASAVCQTWPNREIIVVDDCSTDESWSVIQALAVDFPEVRAIRHDINKGYPGALNTILSEARGEFVAFFDDDDASAPNRIERQFERIAEYRAKCEDAPVFCYTNREVVFADECGSRFTRLGIGRASPEPNGPIVADFVLGLLKDDGHHCWGMFGSCTLMARVEDFRRFSAFDPEFRRCAELDFAVRAALEGAHFISVNESLITQFITATFDKSGKTDLNYKLKLLKKHAHYLKKRQSYLGACCAVYAQFYRDRHWVWRLWYLAALLLFPARRSWERLKYTGFMTRLSFDFTRGYRNAAK